MSTEKADTAEIARTLRLLVEAGQVVEVRALDVPQRYGQARTVSGYFDDLTVAAVAIGELSGRAKAVYITLNPAEPALLSRRANRVDALNERDSTTGDGHVLKRTRLLFDFDPERVSGVSSTDEEHERAVNRASRARAFLTEAGWSEPLFGDSGNGGHLVYAIDLPVNDNGLVKSCLEALDRLFGGEGVHVDLAVHNPSRISKVYGTFTQKGDDTALRPHRMAHIIEAPDVLLPVARTLLETLAATRPSEGAAVAVPTRTAAKASVPASRLDLGDWLDKHGIAVSGPRPWQGGRIWEFKVCPWNPDHHDGSAWAAQLPSGALSAGCHHQSCSAFDWAALRRVAGDEASDAADDADAPLPNRAKASQATRMVALADEAGAVYWHTPAGDAYATVPVRDHFETLPLKGKLADRWLRRQYFEASAGEAPGGQAVSDALNVLGGRAVFDGDEHAVHVRVAEHGADIYIDLGTADWTAVQISAGGWEVVRNYPVKFRRPKGIRPLPTPVPGGTIGELRPFLNTASDEDFRLMVTTVVASFFPTGPYPVVVLGGEQGSAKSTTARLLRVLVDPSTAPLRSQPRDEHDLVIAAGNGWIINFDNLSGMPTWLSDAICRLATGGGFAARELYSDADEVLFDSQRPVIINGIDDLLTRGDLLDRAVAFNLPSIPEEKRRTEDEFWREFNRHHARIFGALLDAAVKAIELLPGLETERLPRLADFAKRGIAMACAVGWKPDAFLSSYRDNRRAGHLSAFEDSALARTVAQLADDRGSWSGTATELLTTVGGMVSETTSKDRGWPKSPRGLSDQLRRVLPAMRAMGVDVRFDRDPGRGRTRLIHVVRLGKVGGPASAASEPSEAGSFSSDAEDASDIVPEGFASASSGGFRFGSDDADGPDDESADFTNRPRCRCTGCNTCQGAGKTLHEAARLACAAIAHGLCSWCERSDGRPAELVLGPGSSQND